MTLAGSGVVLPVHRGVDSAGRRAHPRPGRLRAGAAPPAADRTVPLLLPGAGGGGRRLRARASAAASRCCGAASCAPTRARRRLTTGSMSRHSLAEPAPGGARRDRAAGQDGAAPCRRLRGHSHARCRAGTWPSCGITRSAVPEGYGYADPQICITPENFERHVAYLSRAYAIVRLDEADGAARRGRAAAAERRRDHVRRRLRRQPRGGAHPGQVRRHRDLLHHRRLPARAGSRSGRPRSATWWRPSARRGSRSRRRASRSTCRSSPTRERAAAVKALTKAFKSNLIPVREELRDQLRHAGRRSADAAHHADLGRGARDAPARHDHRVAHHDAPQPAERRTRGRARRAHRLAPAARAGDSARR